MKIHLLNENTYLDMANALAEGPFWGTAKLQGTTFSASITSLEPMQPPKKACVQGIVSISRIGSTWK